MDLTEKEHRVIEMLEHPRTDTVRRELLVLSQSLIGIRNINTREPGIGHESARGRSPPRRHQHREIRYRENAHGDRREDHPHHIRYRPADPMLRAIRDLSRSEYICRVFPSCITESRPVMLPVVLEGRMQYLQVVDLAYVEWFKTVLRLQATRLFSVSL